jgi:hypothetical protein
MRCADSPLENSDGSFVLASMPLPALLPCLVCVRCFFCSQELFACSHHHEQGSPSWPAGGEACQPFNLSRRVPAPRHADPSTYLTSPRDPPMRAQRALVDAFMESPAFQVSALMGTYQAATQQRHVGHAWSV